MAGFIAGRRTPHLSERPLKVGGLGFEVAPDPGLRDALCKGIEPEVFFPERGDHRTAQLAREICAACPVKVACLLDALRTEGDASRGHRYGIRGGANPEERWVLHRLGHAVLEASAAVVASEPAPRPVAVTRAPVECGTRAGYQKHRRNGETVCDACRFANAAADRRLRTTGSTKEAAA